MPRRATTPVHYAPSGAISHEPHERASPLVCLRWDRSRSSCRWEAATPVAGRKVSRRSHVRPGRPHRLGWCHPDTSRPPHRTIVRLSPPLPLSMLGGRWRRSRGWRGGHLDSAQRWGGWAVFLAELAFIAAALVDATAPSGAKSPVPMLSAAALVEATLLRRP